MVYLAARKLFQSCRRKTFFQKRFEFSQFSRTKVSLVSHPLHDVETFLKIYSSKWTAFYALREDQMDRCIIFYDTVKNIVMLPAVIQLSYVYLRVKEVLSSSYCSFLVQAEILATKFPRHPRSGNAFSGFDTLHFRGSSKEKTTGDLYR